MQVAAKDVMEWAYWNDYTEEWIVVDKSVLDTEDLPSGYEKLIGFEGRPDPSSGKCWLQACVLLSV